jgi:hypothetical protein
VRGGGCDLIAGIAILEPQTAIAILDELLPERGVDEELAAIAVESAAVSG